MISWAKRNWALIVLIVIALSWGKNNLLGSRSYSSVSNYSGQADTMMAAGSVGMALPSFKMFGSQVAPTESSSRMVIQDTSLSLQVKDVAAEIKSIETTTKGLGGFLVNSHLSKPDSAASGNITVRIPEVKRAEAMEAFKKLAVKVVSESVSGTDVTDQYVDLDAQLAVLVKTKIKFEDILDKATAVTDLLNVQRELINLQSQIDSVKGQQKYYEQSAKLSLVSIYLSTDELALPYAPTNEWRPAVVFKEAVRSLVSTFRSIADLFIWGFVYIPIIIPILGAIWIYKKRQNKLK